MKADLYSREGLEKKLLDLIAPLIPLYTEDRTGINIGYTSAHYEEETIGLGECRECQL